MEKNKNRILGWGILLISIVIWWIFGSRLLNQIYVQPRGTGSDFYLVWHGAYELWQGNTPYTDEVTREIQVKILGYEVPQGENEYRFVYPAYSAFVFLPFTALDYSSAYLHWLTFQPLLLIAAIILALKTFSVKLHPLLVTLLIVISFSSRYFWLGMILGQTAIFILFLLALAVYLSSQGHEDLAALPLAIATVKPQLAFFVILGWAMWLLSRRRWRPLLIFSGAVLALVILPIFWIGFWPLGFYRQISAYWGYTGASSTLTLFISSLFGDGTVMVFVLGATTLAIFSLWKLAKTAMSWSSVLGMSVVFTLFIVPLSYVYDLILLVLPWIFVIVFLLSRAGVRKNFKVGGVTLIPLLSWVPLYVFFFILRTSGELFDVVILDKIILPLIFLLLFPLLLPKMKVELDNSNNDIVKEI